MERRKDATYGTVELERKYAGQMFGGDCYVILYTYTARGRENQIVYYWLVCERCVSVAANGSITGSTDPAEYFPEQLTSQYGRQCLFAVKCHITVV